MNFRRASMVVSPRYRTAFLVALAGFACGFAAAELRANRLNVETQRYIAAARDIRSADEHLAKWRQTYLGAALPPAIAAIALSPEQSWQTLETRKALLSAFEKTQPTGDTEKLLLSDRASTLIESGQRKP